MKLPGPERRLVSCLMVTQAPRWRGGLPLGVLSWLRQSHAPRELVIVTADPCEVMHEFEREAAGVRLLVASPGLSIGRLRGLTLENASGDFIATWDDDDVSHADRLAAQLEAFEQIPTADACMLTRVLVWEDVQPHRRFLSPRSAWEPTLVARRESMPGYEDVTRGEDSILCQRLPRVVLIDAPDLYTYRVHEGSTTGLKMVGRWWEKRTSPGVTEGMRTVCAEPWYVAREERVYADEDGGAR